MLKHRTDNPFTVYENVEEWVPIIDQGVPFGLPEETFFHLLTCDSANADLEAMLTEVDNTLNKLLPNADWQNMRPTTALSCFNIRKQKQQPGYILDLASGENVRLKRADYFGKGTDEAVAHPADMDPTTYTFRAIADYNPLATYSGLLPMQLSPAHLPRHGHSLTKSLH